MRINKLLVVDSKVTAARLRKIGIRGFRVLVLEGPTHQWPDIGFGVNLKTMRSERMARRELLEPIEKFAKGSDAEVYVLATPSPEGEFLAAFIHSAVPTARRVRLNSIGRRSEVLDAIKSASKRDARLANSVTTADIATRLLDTSVQQVLERNIHSGQGTRFSMSPLLSKMMRALLLRSEAVSKNGTALRSERGDALSCVEVQLTDGHVLRTKPAVRGVTTMFEQLLRGDNVSVTVSKERVKTARSAAKITVDQLILLLSTQMAPWHAVRLLDDMYRSGFICYPDYTDSKPVQLTNVHADVRGTRKGVIDTLQNIEKRTRSGSIVGVQRVEWAANGHQLLVHEGRRIIRSGWDANTIVEVPFLNRASAKVVSVKIVEATHSCSSYTISELLAESASPVREAAHELERAVELGYVNYLEQSGLVLPTQRGALAYTVANFFFPTALSQDAPTPAVYADSVRKGADGRSVLRAYWTEIIQPDRLELEQRTLEFQRSLPNCARHASQNSALLMMGPRPNDVPYVLCTNPECGTALPVDVRDGRIVEWSSRKVPGTCPRCQAATLREGLSSAGKYVYCTVCQK